MAPVSDAQAWRKPPNQENFAKRRPKETLNLKPLIFLAVLFLLAGTNPWSTAGSASAFHSGHTPRSESQPLSAPSETLFVLVPGIIPPSEFGPVCQTAHERAVQLRE